MICVSIGRRRHRIVRAEHQALVTRGAELVELRLDYLSNTPDLKRLLPNRPGPVVITCRRAEDRGQWRGSEEQRQTLLRAAIVAGADYVDLEGDLAASIRRYGPTKRIISYHNFEETPLNIEQIHAEMAGRDPDIVKLATMANSPSDNVRMLNLVRNARVPTVGFCMGEIGVMSRVLTGACGAPFTYAAFSKDRALAPGQLTFHELRKMFRYEQISSDTLLYGVIGDPIAHSHSPLIHNAGYIKTQMNAVYLPLRVPAGAMRQAFEQYTKLGFRGFSVTLPHKSAALELVPEDHLGAEVQSIGAANTLYRDEQNEWRTANTDYGAALDCIRLGLASKEADPSTVSLTGKRFLMLGAGGVARAIGLGIQRAGGALVVSNRSSHRGIELARELGALHVAWENRGAQFADVLINCTSVGMHPRIDETPYAQNWIREGMLVFDTVYNPETTLLLRQARERGSLTVSGIEMFIRQAAQQFELFTNQPAPQETFRKNLRAAISPVKGEDES